MQNAECDKVASAKDSTISRKHIASRQSFTEKDVKRKRSSFKLVSQQNKTGPFPRGKVFKILQNHLQPDELLFFSVTGTKGQHCPNEHADHEQAHGMRMRVEHQEHLRKQTFRRRIGKYREHKLDMQGVKL